MSDSIIHVLTNSAAIFWTCCTIYCAYVFYDLKRIDSDKTLNIFVAAFLMMAAWGLTISSYAYVAIFNGIFLPFVAGITISVAVRRRAQLFKARQALAKAQEFKNKKDSVDEHKNNISSIKETESRILQSMASALDESASYTVMLRKLLDKAGKDAPPPM